MPQEGATEDEEGGDVREVYHTALSEDVSSNTVSLLVANYCFLQSLNKLCSVLNYLNCIIRNQYSTSRCHSVIASTQLKQISVYV